MPILGTSITGPGWEELTGIQVRVSWPQYPLPAVGNPGLNFVTADNVDTILTATAGAEQGRLDDRERLRPRAPRAPGSSTHGGA